MTYQEMIDYANETIEMYGFRDYYAMCNSKLDKLDDTKLRKAHSYFTNVYQRNRVDALLSDRISLCTFKKEMQPAKILLNTIHGILEERCFK